MALFGALFAGLGWEIFEYIVREFFASNYAIDTLSDLLTDLVGAGAGYWVVSKNQRILTLPADIQNR